MAADADAEIDAPGPVSASRFRCTACGNLTRFDVTTTRRTTAFHHFTVGGELRVEDEQVLSEVVESVTCRWCATGTAVEHLDAVDATEEGRA